MFEECCNGDEMVFQSYLIHSERYIRGVLTLFRMGGGTPSNQAPREIFVKYRKI